MRLASVALVFLAALTSCAHDCASPPGHAIPPASSSQAPSSLPVDAAIADAGPLADAGRAIADAPGDLDEQDRELRAGESTRLRVTSTPRSDRLDGPDPTTTVLLRATGRPARTVTTLTWGGEWAAIGYCPAIHAYVLDLVAIVGAWRMLRAIRYVDEQGVVRESHVNDGGFGALAAVARADACFIAFVASTAKIAVTGGFRLHLLDVKRDALRELGAAPAPPPVEPDLQSTLCKSRRARVWGDSTADSVESMDDGIITFSDARVRVSYGADACGARATKRTVKEWPLP